jgi:mannose-6-phosphate isomerase class I
MKIVKKCQAQKFNHGKSCAINEYPVADGAIDGCVAKISGRYPENGSALNEISKELAYVVFGSGKITIENQEYEISQGDTILIQPGEKFYWQGNFELFIAWTPAQYKLIE